MCYPDRAEAGPHSVPGSPRVVRIELRQAIVFVRSSPHVVAHSRPQASSHPLASSPLGSRGRARLARPSKPRRPLMFSYQDYHMLCFSSRDGPFFCVPELPHVMLLLPESPHEMLLLTFTLTGPRYIEFHPRLPMARPPQYKRVLEYLSRYGIR